MTTVDGSHRHLWLSVNCEQCWQIAKASILPMTVPLYLKYWLWVQATQVVAEKME